MKFCRSKDIRQTHTFVFGIILVLFIVMICVLPNMKKGTDGVWKFFIFTVFVVAIVHSLYLLWQFRRYAVSQEGITVAYLPKWTHTIPWGSISEIAICRLHYNTKLGWETVIRIAVGSEIRGPDDATGDWAFESYSIKNQYRLILIDYSEATLEEFKAICPFPIRDYRHR